MRLKKVFTFFLLVLILGVGGYYIFNYYYIAKLDKTNQTASTILPQEVMEGINKTTDGGKVIKISGDKVTLEVYDKDKINKIEKDFTLTKDTKYRTTDDKGVFIDAKKEDIKADISLLVTLISENSDQISIAEILKAPTN